MASRFIDPDTHWPGHCVHCGCPIQGNGDRCPICDEPPFTPSPRAEISAEEETEIALAR